MNFTVPCPECGAPVYMSIDGKPLLWDPAACPRCNHLWTSHEIKDYLAERKELSKEQDADVAMNRLQQLDREEEDSKDRWEYFEKGDE